MKLYRFEYLTADNVFTVRFFMHGRNLGGGFSPLLKIRKAPQK